MEEILKIMVTAFIELMHGCANKTMAVTLGIVLLLPVIVVLFAYFINIMYN